MNKILFLMCFALWVFCESLGAHGITEGDKAGMVSGGFVDFVWLGAKHMVTGYDHILFLFGVIFFLTKFRDVVTFITAFTIGHSVTLIFATFAGITANEYLIDAVIALTVIYKGFDNLDGFRKFFGKGSPNLLVMVMIFGLIHGFGLSTRLQQLPLTDHGLLSKILAFNIGVELGQIFALGIMLVALSFWRKTDSFKKFSLVANGSLMLAGVYLFGLQMTNYYFETSDHRSPGVHTEETSSVLETEHSKKENHEREKVHTHGHNGHHHEGHHH